MAPIVLVAFLTLGDTPEATVAAFVKAFNENDVPGIVRQVAGGTPFDAPLNPVGATLKATIVKSTLAEDDAYLEVDVEASGREGFGVESRKGRETVHLRRTDGDWRIVPMSNLGMPSLGMIAMFATDNSIVRQARRAAKTTACLSNVKQLALGTILYASDHDDVLPKDASRWKATIMPYVKDEAIFHCPEDASGAVGYFFDSRLAGRSLTAIGSPGQTAMIVEGTPKAPAFRHGGRASMGYVDGHAKVVAAEEVGRARKVSFD